MSGPKRNDFRPPERLEVHRAYVPDPLPPPIEWDPDLVASLSAADRAIGRLAGEGRRLPNPHLLIRPFIRREAVLSSRIEGTQATLGELLAAEAGAAVARSPADLREVADWFCWSDYIVVLMLQCRDGAQITAVQRPPLTTHG